MDPKYQSFHKHLSQLIRTSGKSQSTVAKHLGINKSVLHNWCNGVQPSGLEGLSKLAEYFGVSLEELLTGRKMDPVKIEIRGECEGSYKVVVEKL